MEIKGEEREEFPFKVTQPRYILAQVALRALAFMVTLVATLVMALNKQTSDFAGYPLEANYSLSPVFKFFVGGNAVGCGYSLLSLPFVSYLIKGGKGWLLQLLDLVIMGLVMAAASAATAIGYLGKEGNPDIGWSEVCPYYEAYCNRMGVALVFSFFGFLLFLLICALSCVYKILSK